MEEKGGASGRIRVHPAGYGFVQRDDGDVDVFVPAKYRGAALDGDRVKLTTWLGHKGTEGKVDEIVERGRARITGNIKRVERRYVIEPDDPRIPGGVVQLEGGIAGAREGQSVVAEIVRYPSDPSEGLTARVTKVLGNPDDLLTEVEKIVQCAEIPDEFPEEVVNAGLQVPTEVTPAELVDRTDLRDRDFLTIDPVTARDFDDAICIEPRPRGGALAWVAVADVSHYVKAGSAIDREARVRGCSVYLPNRAIPMLPEQLSSHICSLLPEVDRCASVVRMEISPEGAVISTSFMSAVIRSRARLDYEGVAAALEGDFRGPRARYRDWQKELELMNETAIVMRKKRAERGALELELPEAKVMLDEDDPKLVRDVVRSKASESVRGAYQLVESFMLAANEAVARFFSERNLATPWRIHDVPDPERLEQFAELANAFGIKFKPEEATSPKAMQHFLASVKGKPYERSLSFMALRTLKQAQYSVDNVGHYGLASEEYLHFTSPIRRYPDLITHRFLKHQLHNEGMPSGGIKQPPPPSKEQLMAICREASETERRAAQAEREVVDMYRAYLMRDRVGEEFDGTITAITSFGIFVELKEPFVEGMVRPDTIGGDSWEYDERRQALTGRRSGRSFSLGQEVRVRIENVSVARRRIELAFVSGAEAAVDTGESYPLRDRLKKKPDHRPGGGSDRGRRNKDSRPGSSDRRDGRKRSGHGFKADSASRGGGAPGGAPRGGGAPGGAPRGGGGGPRTGSPSRGGGSGGGPRGGPRAGGGGKRGGGPRRGRR